MTQVLHAPSAVVSDVVISPVEELVLRVCVWVWVEGLSRPWGLCERVLRKHRQKARLRVSTLRKEALLVVVSNLAKPCRWMEKEGSLLVGWCCGSEQEWQLDTRCKVIIKLQFCPTRLKMATSFVLGPVLAWEKEQRRCEEKRERSLVKK